MNLYRVSYLADGRELRLHVQAPSAGDALAQAGVRVRADLSIASFAQSADVEASLLVPDIHGVFAVSVLPVAQSEEVS